jgi:hypothetical protein
MFTGLQTGGDRPTQQRLSGSSAPPLGWLGRAKGLILHQDAHLASWERRKLVKR